MRFRLRWSARRRQAGKGYRHLASILEGLDHEPLFGAAGRIDRYLSFGKDPAWEREIRDAVTGAFRSLPATLQAAATLALVEERPYEEIAEALGTSTSAVKSRIFRAVRILRRKLERLGIKP